MKTKIISALVLVIFGGLLMSSFAMAQTAGDLGGLSTSLPGQVTNVDSVTDAWGVVRNIVKWIYIAFFILAVVFILMAAFNFLTSGGDSGKVSDAKNQIIYAVVAIVVALIALSFESIVRNFLMTGS